MKQENKNNSEERQLKLVGITYNQIESGVYALILEEVDGNRRIPIVIGYPEAQAIECKLQEVVTPRPLTHDLISMMLISLGAKLEKVVIRRLPTGVFAAYLHIIDRDGIPVRIDARSSDAIAIAIRINAPIYTSAEVIDEAGFSPEEVKRRAPRQSPRRRQPAEQEDIDLSKFQGNTIIGEGDTKSPESMSLEELNEYLQKLVADENYEAANEIKKLIDNRTQNEE